jgi:hypothetical protein
MLVHVAYRYAKGKCVIIKQCSGSVTFSYVSVSESKFRNTEITDLDPPIFFTDFEV